MLLKREPSGITKSQVSNIKKKLNKFVFIRKSSNFEHEKVKN